MADPPTHQTRSEWARRLDQSDRVGLDDVLRPVLPVAVVSLPAACQHLPDALGSQEVQAAAWLQAVQGVVVRARRSSARAVQALGVGTRVRVDSMRRAE